MLIEGMTDDELEYQKEFLEFAKKFEGENPVYAIQKLVVTKTAGENLTYSITVRKRW